MVSCFRQMKLAAKFHKFGGYQVLNRPSFSQLVTFKSQYFSFENGYCGIHTKHKDCVNHSSPSTSRSMLIARQISHHEENAKQKVYAEYYSKTKSTNTQEIDKYALQAKHALHTKLDINNSYGTLASSSEPKHSIKFSSTDPNFNNDDIEKFSSKPTKEQLLAIEENLAKYMPVVFSAPQDYRIYHKNIIFINNIKGVTIKGIGNYIAFILKTRLMGHLTSAYIKFDILKMTLHPEEGTIKMRWRISKISGLKIFLKFWKYRVWKIKKMVEEEGDWIDGFSIYHVGKDGLIHKHICDKMMPDDNTQVAKSDKLGVKLALFIGLLVPKDPFIVESFINFLKN